MGSCAGPGSAVDVLYLEIFLPIDFLKAALTELVNANELPLLKPTQLLILNHVTPVCYQELSFRVQYFTGNLFAHLPKPAPGHLSQLESVFVDTLSFIIQGPFQGFKELLQSNQKHKLHKLISQFSDQYLGQFLCSVINTGSFSVVQSGDRLRTILSLRSLVCNLSFSWTVEGFISKWHHHI